VWYNAQQMGLELDNHLNPDGSVETHIGTGNTHVDTHVGVDGSHTIIDVGGTHIETHDGHVDTLIIGKK
jgi:hypothetical protein